MSVFCFLEVILLKLLEEKIMAEGKVFPGNILKVGSFLNHQLDVDFLMEMGHEIKRLFDGSHITKIVTIEASGIAIAVAAAAVMHVPVVFAKKNKSKNLTPDVYKTRVHSYTHGQDYDVVISKEFLTSSDNILIIDDFLANGAALEGLIDIANQAGASVEGVAIAIEKAFQEGGKRIRAKGIRIESLAMIESMDDNSVKFVNDGGYAAVV